jgi:hypothetical protein
MTRKDKIVIIALVVFSLAGLAVVTLPVAEHEALHGVVRVKGEVVNNIDLNVEVDSRINVTGALGVSVLEVKGGKLRMLSSPCPDKICVNQGWVCKPGEVIVCVPNAVSVSIEGDGGVDAIIR